MANISRKVIKCDKEGNDIATFESTKEAALSFGSATGNAICKAIKHGHMAFGYRWRYLGEPLYIRREGTPGKSRKIISIDIDNKEVIYKSISEASRSLGIGITAIESALLMGCEAKGYHFRYEGEPIAKSYKHDRHRKRVVSIDDNGNVVEEYSSAQECAKALGVIDAAVYRCLNKKYPNAKCKGYRLRYLD